VPFQVTILAVMMTQRLDQVPHGSLSSPIVTQTPPHSRFDSDLSTRFLPHAILLLSIHHNLKRTGLVRSHASVLRP
jgi:hypothetical protein